MPQSKVNVMHQADWDACLLQNKKDFDEPHKGSTELLRGIQTVKEEHWDVTTD